jgi:hypothetical protein
MPLISLDNSPLILNPLIGIDTVIIVSRNASDVDLKSVFFAGGKVLPGGVGKKDMKKM